MPSQEDSCLHEFLVCTGLSIGNPCCQGNQRLTLSSKTTSECFNVSLPFVLVIYSICLDCDSFCCCCLFCCCHPLVFRFSLLLIFIPQNGCCFVCSYTNWNLQTVMKTLLRGSSNCLLMFNTTSSCSAFPK